MPELSRSQLVVYGALACVVLLLGARWIRSSEPAGSDAGGVAFAQGAGAAPSGQEQGFIPGEGDVVVHVAGEVSDPGVYRLPEGSRVTDAVKRAGGASAGAAIDGINLAAELTDGQQVVVPARAAPAATSAAGGVAQTAASGPISLGTATVEDLDTIEGIGPVTAAQIIEFRDQNGVGSIDDLDQISGIGPTTMEALRARLQP